MANYLFSLLSLFVPLYVSAQVDVTHPQFGAKGDGIHDDTEAIQSALTHGGKVFLPAGVYVIHGKLSMKSGTFFYGESGSIIKQTADSFILYNEHAQIENADWDENITIRNISFDGSSIDARSEYTAGLYMCGVRNLRVEDCTLTDIGGDGIYLGRAGRNRYCDKVFINNNLFDNCGRNKANPRQSIAVVFADNVRITNCTMRNRRKHSYAVDVEPNNADEHCSVTVLNCRMIGCGISCGGNNAAKRTILISDCYIDCSGTENATLSVVRSNAKLTNNTIISNGIQNGINIVTSPSAEVKRNIISDASAGVLITDGADNVMVKGNKIENCTSGVYVIKSKGVAILSNILKSRGKGVYVRMKSEGVRVESNSISTETGEGVFSDEASDIRIRRNKKIKWERE